MLLTDVVGQSRTSLSTLDALFDVGKGNKGSQG